MRRAGLRLTNQGRQRVRWPLAFAMAVAVLVACSSGPGGLSARTSAPPGAGPTGPSSVPPATPGQAGSWSTYHRSNDRTGAATDVPRPTGLASAWTVRLDGPVYGQPVVVGSTVIAATERDSVYGIDLASGGIRWSRHLGTPVQRSDLPCGNIDPLGITGSPAYDAPTGSVFVVTETTGAKHDLVSLDVRTGVVRFVRNLDVTSRDRSAEQQRGALAVANGRVYVPFGGLYGDCGDYIGYVAAVGTNGRGPIAGLRGPDIATGRNLGALRPRRWRRTARFTSRSGTAPAPAGRTTAATPCSGCRPICRAG